MPKDGEEIYIDPVQTQILRVIGEHNPRIKETEVFKILEALVKKLKRRKSE